jgi:hypothetical protein
VGLRRGVSLLLAFGVFAAVALVAVNLQSTASASGFTALTLRSSHSYTPAAPGGGTDDYHCTLVDPNVRADSEIVASRFFPESPEVHHAILFLVPPALADRARAADVNGQGWTCFGETALPGSNLAQISDTPWLTAWAPGHGLDVVPKGTGVPLPKGSLVVMQIHYNLLRGDAPVRSKLVLDTVPMSRHLLPLHLDLLPAPPDVPCPAGVTGPLCNRLASLVDLGQRFGKDQVRFVNVIESVCGRNVINPPAGNTTSCVWPAPDHGKVVRVTAHMHLLGRGMQIVLNPGSSHPTTLLNVTNYNFDYQRSYDLATPVSLAPGDTIGVTCTYDPTLRQKLPELRRIAPRFVTWGDGSSDEMCLALVQSVG